MIDWYVVGKLLLHQLRGTYLVPIQQFASLCSVLSFISSGLFRTYYSSSRGHWMKWNKSSVQHRASYIVSEHYRCNNIIIIITVTICNYIIIIIAVVIATLYPPWKKKKETNLPYLSWALPLLKNSIEFITRIFREKNTRVARFSSHHSAPF